MTSYAMVESLPFTAAQAKFQNIVRGEVLKFFRPLGSSGGHFLSLGDHFGSSWGSFGVVFGALALRLGAFGGHFGSLGGSFGGLGAVLGRLFGAFVFGSFAPARF